MKKTVSILAMTTLVACGGGATTLGPGSGGGVAGGGGGGGVGGGGSGSGSTVVVFSLNNATADAQSQLAGQALISDTLTIRNATATLDHNTRNLTNFTDGVTTFSDTNGDENLTWSDGTNTLRPVPDQTPYDFAAIFNLTTPSNGSGPLIGGVRTPQSALPLTGGAQYDGEGFINGATLGAGGIAATATSRITVNYDADTVSAVLTAINGSAPFDTLRVDGMDISLANSKFTGGTVTVLSGGANNTAAVVGTGATSDGAGTFFGANTAGDAPAEIGGVFSLSGTDGTISGGFLAN